MNERKVQIVQLPNYKPPTPEKLARQRGRETEKALTRGVRYGEALMRARDEAPTPAERRQLDQALGLHYKSMDLLRESLFGGQ